MLDPSLIPDWQKPSAETLEKAAAKELPLVIWFQGENEVDASFSGKELAEISKDSAVFIKISHNPDRAPSPWQLTGVVPVSKLLSDNPARDYKVPAGRGTVIIADSWGNKHFEVPKAPNFKTLEGYLARVKAESKKANDKLQKNLDAARTAKEKADRKGALNSIMKNFRDGLYGLPAQEETVRLYRTIMDEAREEISKLVDAKDATGLRALARELKKTDVHAEIEEAISSIS